MKKISELTRDQLEFIARAAFGGLYVVNEKIDVSKDVNGANFVDFMVSVLDRSDLVPSEDDDDKSMYEFTA
jgi:hypothetical protein